MVTLRIPAPSSMLVVNLLGILGLTGISLAAGGLTGNWWWSVLVGSVAAVGLSVIAATHAAAETAPSSKPTSINVKSA